MKCSGHNCYDDNGNKFDEGYNDGRRETASADDDTSKLIMMGTIVLGIALISMRSV